MNPVSVVFNLFILAVVAAGIGYGYFGYVNAPTKEELTRYFDGDIELTCQSISGEDKLIINLKPTSQRFEVHSCVGLQDSYSSIMASVYEDELWELHINEFQKVRYERTRVKPIFFSFFFLYFVVPAILIRMSLTEVQERRRVNEKDAFSSLMMGTGLAVLLLFAFGGSLLANILSSFTGLIFAMGLYTLLVRLHKQGAGE